MVVNDRGQLDMFSEQLVIEPVKEVTAKPTPLKVARPNGTKDAISRYSGLKARLDADIFNQGWFEVDTRTPYQVGTELNYVDLFAGCGGISQGFKQAGLNKIFSVEIENDAANTLRKNFPESHHFEMDIQQLTEQQMDEVLNNRKVHIVVGGPPCQGFSVAGLRRPHDPRNQLFKEYVRVVRHLKPDYLVLENVPGILTMQKGEVYKEIIRQFEELGYSMSVRILEAATFGVPQLRARAVFIGNKKGLKNPYPAEQYTKDNYVPIEAVIDDLKDKPVDKSIHHDWTQHSEKMEKRLAKIPPGGSLYETFRDAWKRQYRGVPCMTIKENHGGVHVHYEKNRVLSAREMARLQTFPDDFVFTGTTKRAYWQIGNAVPVKLAQNIAEALKSQYVNL